MLVEILKNPVIFGLLAGIIVYNYMEWNRKKEIEKRLKKGKKIKDSMKKTDIIIPSIVAIIVWFISFAYFNYKEEKSNTTQIQTNIQSQPIKPLQSLPSIQTLQPIQQSPSDVAHSFTMINKSSGITVPPDVMI
jgi:hypothetical protein